MSVQSLSESAPTDTGLPVRARRLGTDPRDALALARRPWTLETAAGTVTVRGAVPADLRGVALMHGRCSAQTLLQRYLRGGTAPSLTTMSALLQQPLVVVALSEAGDVVGLASGSRPAQAPGRDAEPGRTLQARARGAGRRAAPRHRSGARRPRRGVRGAARLPRPGGRRLGAGPAAAAHPRRHRRHPLDPAPRRQPVAHPRRPLGARRARPHPRRPRRLTGSTARRPCFRTSARSSQPRGRADVREPG
nr:hypothetical protein [Angustibacter aerolatus]